MDSRWSPPNPPGLPGVHLEYVEQGKVLLDSTGTRGQASSTINIDGQEESDWLVDCDYTVVFHSIWE